MNAKTDFSRRTVSISLLSVVGIGLIPVTSTSAGAVQLPLVRISRDASCGCCKLWADHLQGAGFPVEIINRLLQERPDITGITLPGMPGNAPGMADAKSGTLKIYAFSPAGITVYSDE